MWKMIKLALVIVLGMGCALLLVQVVSGQEGLQNGTTAFYTDANSVQAMGIHDDHLWVGTSGGVVRWNTLTGAYAKYTTRDGLPSNTINSVAVGPDGSIWVGTPLGVARYYDERWSRPTAQGLTLDQSVMEIAFSPDGEPWIATLGGIYVLHHDGTWDLYTQTQGTVFDIAFETDGTAWIGTYYGLNRVSTEGTWSTYTKTHGLSGDRVFAVAIDDEGTRWFGAADWDWEEGDYVGGVSGLTQEGAWIYYTKADGLINEGVQSIAIDGQGNRWFGTYQGLSRRSAAGLWTSWGWSDLPSSSVSALVEDGLGHMWIGTASGLTEYDGNTLTDHIITDGPISSRVTGLDVDEGNGLWIVGWDSVQRFDGQNWQRFTTADGLSADGADAVEVAPDNSVWLGQREPSRRLSSGEWITYYTSLLSDHTPQGIASDPNGWTWFGHGDGLVHLSGASWTDDSANLATNGKQVEAIAISGTDRWFGGRSSFSYWDGSVYWYYSGLYHYDGVSWETFTATHGLLSAPWGSDVNSLAFDASNVLWIGTRAGVQCHDGITFTSVYTVGNSGLPSNEVNAIAISPSGEKWFATDGGVAVLDGSAWRVYTEAHGLASTGANKLALDHLGNLWIASQSQVSVLNENGLTSRQLIGADGGTIQSLGRHVVAWFPDGTLATTATVTITSKPVSATGELVGISHGFDLSAAEASTGDPVQPTQPITLTYRYAGIDVPLLCDERSLGLYRWSGSEWTTEGITSSVDTVDNIVTAEVTHLSMFAVLGEPAQRVFLPAVMRGYSQP